MQLVGRSSSGEVGVRRAPRTAQLPGGGAGDPGGGASGGGGDGLLSERDLKQLEREHPEGMTAVQVVDIFTARGIRFSEATFRKYVQQGLVPRSRRVGRKGKHQGSLGLYPATTVRRINLIKRLMADNLTIEEIQQQVLRYRDDLEAVERGLQTILSSFEEDLGGPHLDADTRKSLKKDLAEARRGADELLRRLEGIERRVVAPRAAATRAQAAPGGAEDLL
jgi:DNA-binding transcriptional MerR regulator